MRLMRRGWLRSTPARPRAPVSGSDAALLDGLCRFLLRAYFGAAPASVQSVHSAAGVPAAAGMLRDVFLDRAQSLAWQRLFRGARQPCLSFTSHCCVAVFALSVHTRRRHHSRHLPRLGWPAWLVLHPYMPQNTLTWDARGLLRFAAKSIGSGLQTHRALAVGGVLYAAHWSSLAHSQWNVYW